MDAIVVNHKVVHLTSAHPRYDTRIFVKMCTSLALHGYKVSLVVADGLGDEIKNNVNIVDVGGKAGGRINRMTKTVSRVFKQAIELDADLYHLHDPELMPIGLKLKRNGKKVIFDAHEDLPKQILAKPYLNYTARVLLSKLSALYEKWVCKKFDAIVAATPFIRDKFLQINKATLDVNNFPVIKEFASSSRWSDKKDETVYIGGISKIRGIQQTVDAMELVQGARLNLAGKFNEKSIEESVKKAAGWQKVNELGHLKRQEVGAVLAKSKVGLVTLHPTVNYLDSLPVKMFEYMAAGIPVVASNFPLWKKVVEGSDCGVCVDPLDVNAVAKAIQYLIDHPNVSEAMGMRGREAVEEKYNWGIEELKLFGLYERLLN